MLRLVFIICFILHLIPVIANAQTIGSIHHIEEIAEEIYVARPVYSGGNSTIIIEDEFVLVVDSQGSEAAAEVLIDEIARLTSNPVRYVINTHWHGDHHGGNSAFQNRFPDVEIISHPKTLERIESNASVEVHGIGQFIVQALFAAQAHLDAGARNGKDLTPAQIAELSNYLEKDLLFWNAVPDDFRFVLPNRLVEDRLTLDGGDRKIVISHPGPAHTDGDLIVQIPEEGIIILGDILTVPYVVPRSGYPRANARVLDSISQLASELIVPGHGPVEQHKRLMDTMRKFMEDVSKFVEEKIVAGSTVDEIVAAATTNAKINQYENLIEWNQEDGLSFLSFEMLRQITVQRSLVELSEDD